MTSYITITEHTILGSQPSGATPAYTTRSSSRRAIGGDSALVVSDDALIDVVE